MEKKNHKTIQELYNEGYCPVFKVKREIWNQYKVEAQDEIVAAVFGPLVNGGNKDVYIYESVTHLIFFTKK